MNVPARLLLAHAALTMAAWSQTETLPAPALIGPADAVELHNSPREVWFEWSPVPRAESYTIEIDCEHCCLTGKFCSEVSPARTFRATDLQGTKYRFEWYGDQRGRWRVWAVAGFLEGEKSPWRTLSFTTGNSPAPPQAPKPIAPVNNAVLPAEPAEVTFEWTPVVGARSYTLEVDPLSTCVLYKYCSDVGVYRIVENIAETHYTGSFPSQMWTRWRVWAVAGDRASLKSPWTMFQRTSGTPAPMAAALAAPEYTAAARDAGLEGTATVYFEVAASGETKNVKVLQSLGLGLDEKAEQLVSHWRFAPGAAPVQAAEVSFRLDGRQGWRVRRAYYRIIPEERREPESLKPVVKMWQSPPACPAGEYLREQISFRVGKSGVPDKVVVSSSPYASALRDAVLGWRFEPARLSGGNGRAREANAVFDLECGFPAAAAAAANGTPTKPPSVISKIDPAYSEEARQAKYNGSVSIQVIIDQDGFPIKLRIVHPIGLGLDEKALEALKQWRFNPANRGGEPVPYQATVEITFRLL